MGTRYDGTLKWTDDPNAFAFVGDGKAEQPEGAAQHQSAGQGQGHQGSQQQPAQQAQAAEQQQDSGGRRILRR
jgi:hypothetical protein